jgi:hypothetical protein
MMRCLAMCFCSIVFLPSCATATQALMRDAVGRVREAVGRRIRGAGAAPTAAAPQPRSPASWCCGDWVDCSAALVFACFAQPLERVETQPQP